MSDRSGSAFAAVPSAVVDHPWWFGGRRDYSRFARWSFGDSLLHDLHPKYNYRSAPNAVELLAMGLPLAVITAAMMASPIPVVALLVGVPLGEFAGEFARLWALKGFSACLYFVETVLIRSANDVGRIAMQARLRRWHGITERWDHFCNGEHVAYHQRWAAAKFGGHCLSIAMIGWALSAG